jgi:cardiolipin synthase
LVALTALALDHYIPFWVLVVMGIKESFMIGAGLYLYLRKEQKIIPSNLFGKLATVMFSIAIVWIILTPEIAWLQYLIVLAVACKLIAFSSYVTLHFKQKHHDH